MTLTKHKADAINRMGVRLREALKRCDPRLPDSLRLMAVHTLKFGISKAYLGHSEIHPGMKKMSGWGKCSERTAQRNAKHLEDWGLITKISDEKGGRRSTRYWVEPEAVIRFLMIENANPHPDLITEIREFVADTRGDTRGDTCPDTCHPGLRSSPLLGGDKSASHQGEKSRSLSQDLKSHGGDYE